MNTPELNGEDIDVTIEGKPYKAVQVLNIGVESFYLRAMQTIRISQRLIAGGTHSIDTDIEVGDIVSIEEAGFIMLNSKRYILLDVKWIGGVEPEREKPVTVPSMSDMFKMFR